MNDEVPVRCRGRNGKCNRVLKDAESKARGIGPVCEQREAWALGPPGSPAPRQRTRKNRGPRLQSGPDLFDAMKENVDGD